MQAISLLLSDARGIYIPANFAENFDAKKWHLTAKDIAGISDPYNEFYWEDWNSVLDKAYYIDTDGSEFRLYQDGDLWALCYEKMTDEEKYNFDFNE